MPQLTFHCSEKKAERISEDFKIDANGVDGLEIGYTYGEASKAALIDTARYTTLNLGLGYT